VQALTSSYATELKVLFLSAEEQAWTLLAAAGLGLAGAWAAVTAEMRVALTPR
jgi:hypothetical protein